MMNARERATLDRALYILQEMATERTGWRALIFGRWYYSHEPLRNDAANLLRDEGSRFIMPVHTQIVGAERRSDGE